ncbi:MAG: protein kinase domain-containing protein [Planctomycetota bacterium]
MSVRIRIDHGQDAGKTFRLARPGVYVVGRHPAAAIRVLDMKVSKQHCRITVKNGDGARRALLTDLGSTHGTMLNGQPVNGSAPVKPGDEIRLGLSILRVLKDGEADVVAEPLPAEEVGEAAEEAPSSETTAHPRRKRFAPDELVGKEIGGYRVLEKIGQGGMGAVYLAEQMSLHREVALKVLSEKFTSDSNFVDQFVNEARAAGALNHPNVVQVYDVGKETGRYYFSMEYVPGGSLEERLKDGTRDWREALNWLIDAANALIFAKAKEILHRDVKPDNLMVAEDGSAKLCDLGLAKKSQDDDLLAAGIIGTPAFISPEAIRRKKDIDGRSDLYSLGCTFYRILTGKNPYAGKSVKEILLGHLNRPVPRIADVNPEIPGDLDEVIYQLMQKDPDERFGSAQELLQALDRIRVQHGLEAHGIRPATKKPLIIAGLVVLVGIAALIWALTRPTEVIREEDEEARRRAAESARIAAEQAFQAYLSDAKRELGEVKLEARDQNIVTTWSDAFWPTMAGKYEALAGRLEGEEHGAQPTVKAVADDARAEAEKIRSYIALRKELDQDITEGTQQALGELEGALTGRRDAVRKAIGEKRWQAAALLLVPEALDPLIQPFADRKVESVLPADIPAETRRRFEGDPLLDAEADIKPLVTKLLPGEPAGAELVAEILGAAEAEHRARQAEGTQALAKGTHEGYQEAIGLMDAYLGALETPDEKAGEIARALTRYRTEAQELQDDARDASERLFAREIEHDWKAYVSLLRGLRAPRTGLLYGLRFDEARQAAENAAAEMRYAGYRELTEELVLDVGALEQLFQRLAAEFPDGWVSDRIDEVDERGRPRTAKVQDVTPTAVRMGLGGAPRQLADMTADWLLHQLFHVKDGAPRFTPVDDDLRGLAVLAEMAVDYDLADRYYQAYLMGVPADAVRTQRRMRERVGRLGRERSAGEAWRTALEKRAELEAIRLAHDPDVIGEEDFWEERNREALQAKESTIARLAQDCWNAIAVLEDASLADTTWATVARSRLGRHVAYAGEPILPPPPPAGGNGGDEPRDEGAPDEGNAPPRDDDEGGDGGPDDGEPPPADEGEGEGDETPGESG